MPRGKHKLNKFYIKMDTFIKNLLDFYHVKKGVHFLYKFVEPRSKNEDSARREFILNVLLLGTIALAFFATIRTLTDFINLGQAYPGVSPLFSFGVFLLFFFLYLLSREGAFDFAAYVFIGIYFALATYISCIWGIDLPQGLLTYVLVIVISGVLINARFAFTVTLAASFALVLLAYLQNNFMLHPNFYWKKEILRVADTMVFVFTFLIITTVSWLSNREIEKALKRARGSEAELQKERDLLEMRVEDRTRKLKEVQLEKNMYLYRYAEFGRIASGLFHDLVNPVSSVLLNMEELKKKYPQTDNERLHINGISNTMRRVEDFIKATRKQIQNQEIDMMFSLADEICLAVQLFSHKAAEVGVRLLFSPPDSLIQTYGNPIKFYRIIASLISNAIDSYEQTPNKDRRDVVITLSQNNDLVSVSVQDRGCGIKKENMDKIYEPLFTTKNIEKGTGLGLSLAKEATEENFNGTISCESAEGRGAKFTVTFPIKQLPAHEQPYNTINK